MYHDTIRDCLTGTDYVAFTYRIMFPIKKRRCVSALHSTYFHKLLCCYDLIGLPVNLLLYLVVLALEYRILHLQNLQDLPGMHNNPCFLTHPSNHGSDIIS